MTIIITVYYYYNRRRGDKRRVLSTPGEVVKTIVINMNLLRWPRTLLTGVPLLLVVVHSTALDRPYVSEGGWRTFPHDMVAQPGPCNIGRRRRGDVFTIVFICY